MRQVCFIYLYVFLLTGLFIRPVSGFDHSHQRMDNILKSVVVPVGPKSLVRYDIVKEKPNTLERYLIDIENVTLSQYRQWSEFQKIAFLINAYNALTIKLILSEYPKLSSIKDLGGFFSSPWRISFFSLFGKKRDLDYIEHSMLRKEFSEPRIHFALVCASLGCPALRNEAYVADRLDQQLKEAMRIFLRDPDRNYFNKNTNTLKVSSIFKWFKVDFIKAGGSLEAFIAPVITDDLELRRQIRDKEVEIEYLEYNWALNTAKASRLSTGNTPQP